MSFQFFEKLVHPYPDGAVAPPPTRLMPFLWACADGTRRYIAMMTLCTACIGALEALLFAVLGRRHLAQPVDDGRAKGPRCWCWPWC